MPMNFSILKLTRRSIRSSFGRFLAILLIVTLSVGFFSGLKITKSAMAETCNDYLIKQNFFDYRLLSTIGFTDNDVKTFQGDSAVSLAEGGKSVDALLKFNEKTAAYKLIAMPKYINNPALVSGEMPAAENECLVDARVFDENCIGKTIELSIENSKDISDTVKTTVYTITGTASSPLYLGNNRGTANIGSGTLTGFVYIQPENFTGEYYTELYLTLSENAPAYSSDYKKLITQQKGHISELFQTAIENRAYDTLGVSKDDLSLLAAVYGISTEELEEELRKQMDFEEPTTYIFTREENQGYLSFESDTSIISGIANILPIFFILIAMLVCITTMTRMVDEERTQIGVLKAMGYGNGVITGKCGKIENCLFAGSIDVGEGQNRIGKYAIAFNCATYLLQNNYILDDSALNNIEIENVTVLLKSGLTAEFYKDTLKFDETIWVLNNGWLPELAVLN